MVGVKQYDSLENMYADVSNRHNGDIGVVYYSNQSSVQPGDTLNEVTFPDTIIFDTAITSSTSVSIGASFWDRTTCFLSSTSFNVGKMMGEQIVNYVSSDGLIYIKDSGYDTYNFEGATMSSTADINICKFFLVGSLEFQGVFQHNGSNYRIINSGFTAIQDQVWNKNFYGINGIQNGAMQQTTNLNLQQLKGRVNLYSNISSLALNENVTDINYACANLNSIPKLINTSNVTNMSGLFRYCNNITSIYNIDTSSAQDISYMFDNCKNLVNIPELDISNSTKASRMFSYCNNLVELPNLDTSNVKTTTGMFYHCNSLTTIPNLDISNATEMTQMFTMCYNLTEIPNLDISNVTNMFETFAECNNLVSVPVLNMTKVTNTSRMFHICPNLSSESYGNIANSLPYAYRLSYPQPPTVNSTGLNVENFNTEQRKILGNKRYVECIQNIVNASNSSTYWNIRVNSSWKNISKGNYDPQGYNLSSNVQAFANNFSNASVDIYDYGKEGTLYYAENLFSGGNLPNIIKHLNLHINSFNLVSTVGLFSYCKNLISVSNFYTSNVVNMYLMFQYCNSLTTVPNFDTSKVNNMCIMFNSCVNLTTVPNFNTINVTDMQGMFGSCYNLTTVPNFDTSNVVCMVALFHNCTNLVNIPNFNTTNVTNMSYFCNNCYNLVNVPNFDTSKVTNMYYVFYNCYNLVEVSNFDTSNVTNMSCAFYRCYSLVNVPNFNLSRTKNTNSMFFACSNLINTPNMITPNVTDMAQMFRACANLVNVYQYNTSSVTSIYEMFDGCNNLSNASIQNIVNMCLNSNITNPSQKILMTNNSSSPLYNTKFNNSYYQNRWAELDAAGWKY